MECDAKAGQMRKVLTSRNSESFRGCNDLHLASNGDIYFTDQGQTGLHDPTGKVYRYTRSGRLDCLIDTGPSPNGLVLDPNEAVLFVAMTRDNAVWRLPFMKDGSVSKVGRFCSLFGPSGPDGMTMDRAGRLFVAHASLGHVFVFAPNGECIARIKSCAGQSCTNVAIGGAKADRLYITESVTGTVLVADIGTLVIARSEATKHPSTRSGASHARMRIQTIRQERPRCFRDRAGHLVSRPRRPQKGDRGAPARHRSSA